MRTACFAILVLFVTTALARDLKDQIDVPGEPCKFESKYLDVYTFYMNERLAELNIFKKLPKKPTCSPLHIILDNRSCLSECKFRVGDTMYLVRGTFGDHVTDTSFYMNDLYTSVCENTKTC
jgi:hypothetical protein